MCLGDFKFSYFALRNIWKEANKENSETYIIKTEETDYIAKTDIAHYWTAMLWIECFISGLHFIVVVAHYYLNVFDVSLKKHQN